MIVLYSQKLDATKDKNAKNTYKCVVEKIQSGDISFPLDRKKLESSCDEIAQQKDAAVLFEMVGY